MSRKQHFFINERNKCKFYYFADYKIPMPFFLDTIKISIGNPINESYYLVKNIVHKGKQILALKREEDQNTIILVEANIVGGQLKYISMLSDEELTEVSKIVESSIH